MFQETNWHHLSFKEAIGLLYSHEQEGLSEKEIWLRQRKFGKNVLPEEKPPSDLRLFLWQFQNPLIIILVIAQLITLFLKDYTDSLVILAAVILNTSIGFFQERKASHTFQALKRVVKGQALVIRQGEKKIIENSQLVPGDILLLRAGDKIPADARIIEANRFQTNEMVLTGEWLPSSKNSRPLVLDTVLAERKNMAYMGTIAESGKAKVICVATGLKTQIGQIAQSLQKTPETKTPLQKKMAQLSRTIGIIIVLLSLLIFLEGMLTGNTFSEIFLTSIAIAVAAIPEGLPVSLTVILALGMQRILQRGGLVRRVLAAETLGSTSVIIADKTATLTEGKMVLKEVVPASFVLSRKKSQRLERLVLQIGGLANEAFLSDTHKSKSKWKIIGTPTDRAILKSCLDKGIDIRKLRKAAEKVADLPFDPGQKYLASLYRYQGQKVIFASGAPEKILSLANRFQAVQGPRRLGSQGLLRLRACLNELTQKGWRVIAVAQKRCPPKIQSLEEELKNLVFVGFLGLYDPLRKEAPGAINACREAGIKPVLATGDHALTAQTVAKALGFQLQDKIILQGKDLKKISDQELEEIVEKTEVFSRMEPEDKMRIVKAWQRKEQVVAMTGDGVNDAPALKMADIGVALGSGTDVAKEASDLILLNDSFEIIVKAIEEGRAILDNIRKVITYLLSSTFSEVVLIGSSLILGLPLPILPSQILWVNLIEDSLPSIALTFEPKERGVMKRKPESSRVPLFTKEMKIIIFVIGLLTDFILLGLFIWLWSKTKNLEYTRTMIFAGLAIDSLFYVFSCKNLRRNIWRIDLFSNKALILAVLAGLAGLLASVYLPALQLLLKTVPLDGRSWLLLTLLGLLEISLIEITKYWFSQKKR